MKEASLQPSPAAADEDSELIERLRGPDGKRVRDEILNRLSDIERRLAHQGSLLQSAQRMKQILAARLAVQNASAILNRITFGHGSQDAGSAALLQQLFRSPPHDQ
jgi:hypothetical protein